MLNGPPIRALVVDDSILTRRVIAAALASVPDITVVGTASNGAECLAAVEQLQPDVVTLDVEMPGLNGLEVLQRLLERRPIPVIMVSYLTRAGADITVRAMLAGAGAPQTRRTRARHRALSASRRHRLVHRRPPGPARRPGRPRPGPPHGI